jgi:hypothetical protein
MRGFIMMSKRLLIPIFISCVVCSQAFPMKRSASDSPDQTDASNPAPSKKAKKEYTGIVIVNSSGTDAHEIARVQRETAAAVCTYYANQTIDQTSDSSSSSSSSTTTTSSSSSTTSSSTTTITTSPVTTSSTTTAPCPVITSTFGDFNDNVVAVVFECMPTAFSNQGNLNIVSFLELELEKRILGKNIDLFELLQFTDYLGFADLYKACIQVIFIIEKMDAILNELSTTVLPDKVVSDLVNGLINRFKELFAQAFNSQPGNVLEMNNVLLLMLEIYSKGMYDINLINGNEQNKTLAKRIVNSISRIFYTEQIDLRNLLLLGSRITENVAQGADVLLVWLEASLLKNEQHNTMLVNLVNAATNLVKALLAYGRLGSSAILAKTSANVQANVQKITIKDLIEKGLCRVMDLQLPTDTFSLCQKAKEQKINFALPFHLIAMYTPALLIKQVTIDEVICAGVNEIAYNISSDTLNHVLKVMKNFLTFLLDKDALMRECIK